MVFIPGMRGKIYRCNLPDQQISKQKTASFCSSDNCIKTPPCLSGNTSHHSGQAPCLSHCSSYPDSWVGPLEIHTWICFVQSCLHTDDMGQYSSIHPLTQHPRSLDSGMQAHILRKVSQCSATKSPCSFHTWKHTSPSLGQREKVLPNFHLLSESRKETEAPLVSPWVGSPAHLSSLCSPHQGWALAPQKENVLER